MKRTPRIYIASFILLIACSTGLYAQSKKDLQAEVQSLRNELSETKQALATSKKNEATSNARVAAIEAELTDVRATNANLLTNLNRITEESSKKTASISESLTNIQQTERQLRTISDGLTRNDSTTLSILSSIKKTMGENAKIGVSNNVVTLAIDNSLLFGENDKSYQLADTSPLSKIADILKKHPDTRLQIVSYANALNFQQGAPADNLELSALRAIAVSRNLSSELGVSDARITATGKGIEGLNLETTTHFQIRPDYAAIYKSLKDNIKS